MKKNSAPNWRTISMEELWEIQNKLKAPSVLKLIIRPTFPTSRWGNVFTKTATTDVKAVDLLVKTLNEQGRHVRKRICHETTLKLKNRGKFYKIEEKIKSL